MGTTVAQIMRHEAGLAKFDRCLTAKDLQAEQLKDIQNSTVSKIIADQQPLYNLPTTTEVSSKLERQYHALTRGWIVNQIVIRADPKGRTIGEFLQDEIATPLNIQDQVRIGFNQKDYNRLKPKIHDLKFASFWYTWYHLANPFRLLGGGKVNIRSKFLHFLYVIGMPVGKLLYNLNLLTFLYRYMFNPIRNLLSTKRTSPRTKRYLKPKNEMTTSALNNSDEQTLLNLFNSEEVRRSECPSANGHATARALAKMAGSIVEGGKLPNENRIISEKGINEAQNNVVMRSMFYRTLKFGFTNAGWNCFNNGGRKGFVGWMGLGGSVMQWHRELNIGFGYCGNLLELTPSNERGDVLQEVVVECVQQIQLKERSSM